MEFGNLSRAIHVGVIHEATEGDGPTNVLGPPTMHWGDSACISSDCI